MEKENLQKLKDAGKISLAAHKLAKKKAKPGVSLYDLGTTIDKFIEEQGAKPAWPTNLSIDHEAAHNTYSKEEDITLSEENVLKIDIGVMIDGYISDSAQTVVFQEKHEPLKNASYQALKRSKEFLEKNYSSARISDVGKIIEDTILEFGYKPINNLSGHFLGRYKTHDYPSIPNIYTDFDVKFSEFENNFAIEPFASTGTGFVNEGAVLRIFTFLEEKPIRDPKARKLIDEIKSYQGVQFLEDWVGKDLTAFEKKFALRELLRAQIIEGYPVLVDKKGSYVSQTETTFIITEEGLLDLVNIDEVY
jgi:methionyl aminopeptidase